MEEVWAVYLCLFLVVVVYFLMNQKPTDDIKNEKSPQVFPASSSYSSGSVGRRLECSEEELEQSLDRLLGIYDRPDTRKKEAPHEQSTSTHQREPSGKGAQPSQSNVQERTPPRKSHESLVDEIEQAVQETVEADVYMRKRQAQPGSRSHREVQWSELPDKF